MLSFNSCLAVLFGDLNKLNFVFLILKDNLLTFSHSETLLISVCVALLRVLKQLFLHEIVVLSANNINGSNLLLFSMSFLYSRKRIGPTIDPCVQGRSQLHNWGGGGGADIHIFVFTNHKDN